MGSFISNIGSGLTAFSLNIYIYKTTQSVTLVSLLTLCAFLPTIILSPIGGALADRFNRRNLMILGDGFSALGLLYILTAFLIGNIQIWQIFAGITFSAIFNTLTETSYKASISDILTEETYAKASGLVQVSNSAKYLISPLLAGFLLAATNIQTIIIIDIMTFLITISTVTAVKKGIHQEKMQEKSKNIISDIVYGWQIIKNTKGILTLIILISIITFYMGILQTLYTPLLIPLTNTQNIGTIQSISAVGLLISSLFIGIFNLKKDYSKTLSMSLAISGIFFLLLGLTTNLLFITISGFFFFGCLPFINTSAEVLIRKNIRNELQGRVWGIIGVISQIGYIIAYSSVGFLVDHVFNPLLKEGGLFENNIGKILGTGENRGIGLLLMISGILIILISLILRKIKSVKNLEYKKQET
jgi:MFS family permease